MEETPQESGAEWNLIKANHQVKIGVGALLKWISMEYDNM